MIESSSMENGLAIPAAAIARPPTPASLSPSPPCAHQRARPAPRRARHPIPPRRRCKPRAVAPAARSVHRVRVLAHADEKRCRRGRPRRSPARRRRRLCCRQSTGNAGKPGARGVLDRPRTDRRQIETAILIGLWRLDQNADAGGVVTRRCRAQFGDAQRADCRYLPPPRPPARCCPQRPRPALRRTARARRSAPARARYRPGRAPTG